MNTSASTPPSGAAPPPVVASVRIAAPPELVFPYFTDPALAMRWIASRAELDPRPGGVFAIDVDGNPARGTYVEVDPPHRVIFTWGVLNSDELPPGSTWVEVVIEADRDDTVVTLTHHGLPYGFRASHQEGWTRHLGTLGSLFGGSR
jgi:uncharacterized protein YndB with AHSA1/START domain